MKSQLTKINVHPLVLLSVVDHFNRVNLKTRNKRVVGAILGQINNGVAQVSNSYAIPFEEDPNQSNIWFLDHLYHQRMCTMFKKINAKEKFIGWYVTGSQFKAQDIQINQIFRKYTQHPIFLVVDVEHNNELALPTEAYITLQQVNRSGEIIKTFNHVQSTVQAYEPQQIGVQHLLRQIKEISLNSIDANVNLKLQSLRGLSEKIKQIGEYLKKVREGKLPPNNKILFLLQEIINLLPNLNSDELIKAYSAKNNDMMFAIYICAMSRSILALHTLLFISKKDENEEKKQEKKEEKKQQKKQEKKEEKK